MKNIPSYQDCIELVNNNDVFISKDEDINGTVITTFTYRYANYGDFQKKYARNIRGIVFNKKTKEILALPFHKFFNYGEIPNVQNIIDENGVKRITVKADGSLIYFFMIDDKLYAKTKFNSFSVQSEYAIQIVNNNKKLKENIIRLIKESKTPLFEFVSPRNRIVIQYNKEQLIYLGSRNMITGDYDFRTIPDIDNIEYYLFNTRDIDIGISNINNISDLEGVVITLNNDDMIKIKTENYLNSHYLVNGIFNERNLASLLINDEIDDIISKFADDDNILSFIEQTKKKVLPVYNNYIYLSKLFYDNNKDLDRKDYAIKLQATYTDKNIFGLAMSYYLGVSEEEAENKFKEKFISKKLWEE